MKRILFWTCILAANFVFDQDKKPDPPKPKTASVELQRDILREQLAEKQIQADFQSCQSRQWTNEFNAHQAVIQSLSESAFKQAGLDKKDWDFKLDTFEFVKKPEKPEKPEKPKP